MSSKTQGYLFVLLAITIFSVQDAISKHLGSAYPPIFITMIRYWAFASFATIFAAKAPGGLTAAIRTKRPMLQILRGVLLVSQIVTVVYCFASIGLAHSQAIFSATPLLVALLSIPLLGETVGWRRWSAIAAGMIGVLIILKPSGDVFDVKQLLAIFASLLFAFYVIVTRLVSRDDSSVTSFFYTGVVGAVFITALGPFYWTSFSGWDYGWMFMLCVTGISSHYFLIRAYNVLDAAAVQPLTYLQLVYASVIGATIYGEQLTRNMVLGSVIVVSAGIFTIWREQIVARRVRLAQQQPNR
ncbi:DMT family transporter [Oryzifoliimicrobium ureilyticus]|uniref:DMT family transporter n=1 Tax=Oryzifoliimicrobium ureilyticus TaxID=3113724 RepID=UPI003076096E